MKKLLGIVLSAVAMFAFGAVYWMSPLSASFTKIVENDGSAQRQLGDLFKESGTYVIPGDHKDEAKFTERFKAGPLALVHVQLEGRSPMDAKVMVMGFVHELITMIIAALVMGSLPGFLKTYTKRVGFMMTIGGLIAWYGDLGDAIWWYNSWEFSMVVGVYTFLAWTIAGLVLSAFIKPHPARLG